MRNLTIKEQAFVTGAYDHTPITTSATTTAGAGLGALIGTIVGGPIGGAIGSGIGAGLGTAAGMHSNDIGQAFATLPSKVTVTPVYKQEIKYLYFHTQGTMHVDDVRKIWPDYQ
jgi:uncharacterized protein YcfJ